MKEQPKGAIARATAAAEEVAAAMRRRQRERAPRVVLYSAPGEPRILAPGAKGHDALISLGERMVEAAKPANSRIEPGDSAS